MLNNMLPRPGVTLLANPFLKDPNFSRSVVYLCDHSEEGSFGFIVNRSFDQTLNKLLPDTFDRPVKVYLGGPVQMDSVFFIHQYPEMIEGSKKVTQGVYWGGNFEQLIVLINAGQVEEDKIKFFLGYSGWSGDQLNSELADDSWIVTSSKKQFLFDKKENGEELWSAYLKSLGNEFAMMANYPIDPSLN